MYEDLVDQYVKLNKKEEKYQRIASGRYINFRSDYMRKVPNATLAGSLAAWKTLKKKKVPKTFAGWESLGELS